MKINDIKKYMYLVCLLIISNNFSISSKFNYKNNKKMYWGGAGLATLALAAILGRNQLKKLFTSEKDSFEDTSKKKSSELTSKKEYSEPEITKIITDLNILLESKKSECGDECYKFFKAKITDLEGVLKNPIVKLKIKEENIITLKYQLAVLKKTWEDMEKAKLNRKKAYK